MIAKALVEYKRADKVAQYLKDNHLWSHVLSQVDSSQLLTLKDIEILTVFVNGYPPVCDQGKQISYVSYAVGYKFCGPAGKCVCAKKQIAAKVGETKRNTTEEQKMATQLKREATNVIDVCSKMKFSNNHLNKRKQFYKNAQYPFTVQKVVV